MKVFLRVEFQHKQPEPKNDLVHFKLCVKTLTPKKIYDENLFWELLLNPVKRELLGLTMCYNCRELVIERCKFHFFDTDFKDID